MKLSYWQQILKRGVVFLDTIHIDLFLSTILVELVASIFRVVYSPWTTHMVAAPGSTRMSVPAYLSTQHHMLSHTHTCFEDTETVLAKGHF